MDANAPLKYDTNEILSKRREIFESSEEIIISKEKNNEKISLRKKKNMEHLNKIRNSKLKKSKFNYKSKISINIDELIKSLPQHIISEFNTTKNKYSFFITYLSLSDKEDSDFNIRMFAIYQIHSLLNNDITNSSLPSKELLDLLLKYLVYEYNKEQIEQKIKIQNEILQMLIIWISYNDEDNINSVFYEDQFLLFLFDMIDSDLYSIEFKINIIILLNAMIKGANTFNKIINNFVIINKIEYILGLINNDEQYIFVLSLIQNIFNYMDEYINENEEEMMQINNQKEKKVIIFNNTYNSFIMLLNYFYEKYQKRYDELKNNNTPISMDSTSRIYYKIIILLLKIINNSMFIEDNMPYINLIIYNELAIPLFLKIMENYSKEFFISNNIINKNSQKLEINNNIYFEHNSSFKLNEKNNLYKKYKTLIYLTHILTEIISSSDNDVTLPNFTLSYERSMNYIINFNVINYYSNLIKNFALLKIKPDKNLILRIEEFIYNFCELNRDNYLILYKNYELIRELLSLNQKIYNEHNFQLLIKFIINSILLYSSDITKCLIFDVKIITTFIKFLENELGISDKKYEDIKYILYALSKIIDSDTYRKCKINRNSIIYEFNKNNANKVLEQYAILLINNDDYLIVNKILDNLDESDILDANEIEEIYNPSEDL